MIVDCEAQKQPLWANVESGTVLQSPNDTIEACGSRTGHNGYI